MLRYLRLTLVLAATNVVAISNDESGGGGGSGIESGFQAVYNGYKQCEGEADTLSCLKLKALKLVDRALSINNIPITEAISLAKREDNQRSLNEQWTAAAASATNNAIDDENAIAATATATATATTTGFVDSVERDEKLNDLLWKRVRQFVESRSLQFKVNKLLFGDDDDDDDDYNRNAANAKFRDGNGNENENENENVVNVNVNTNGTDDDAWKTTATAARGKKDKNKGMYMYMMMMKGGMMALAYKGLALLAGKALLVSKIALTLALLVAIKKLFSGGHHSQKTTYEIVKTPIITHSHQYGGGGGGAAGPGNPQSGHYAADFTGYDGGPYARSLDEPLLHHHQHQQQQQQRQRQRITLKAVDTGDSDSRYAATATTTTAATLARARSLKHQQTANDNYGHGHDHDHDYEYEYADQRVRQFSIPYAHQAAYRMQLMENTTPTKTTSLKSDTSTATAPAATVPNTT